MPSSRMTVDDLRVDVAAGSATLPADSAVWRPRGGAFEERLADLGAAGVVQADEQDVAHSGGRGRGVRIEGVGDGARRRAARATKAGTDAGAMPAKVSENIRPTLMAGLAKLVELVNQ